MIEVTNELLENLEKAAKSAQAKDGLVITPSLLLSLIEEIKKARG